jgi:hypothetical protein
MAADWGPLDRLVTRADALAGAWAARARASTTIGQERATLRLFGVHGLDAAGRPLAGATIDRWLSGDPRGLATGIALPFAMALLEYDLDPQQLALDVSSGAIDLALEAELLREQDRRMVAETEASRLAAAAVDRIDAQRTVRLETLGVLGDAPRPWLGATLREPELEGALDESAALIAAGLDLIRIEVPIGREWADRLTSSGREAPEWRPRENAGRQPDRQRTGPAPSGSQRALTQLREAVDAAAAERRAYARLATVVPALGAPEGSVVAAFERIDIIASDPMQEIVADGIEPDRALSDHAFAHRIAARAGTAILVGSGPLVVAPDLSAGVPSDPPMRAGRALALQLLGVILARSNGLAADQVIVGALPPWLTDEPTPAARAIAEVMVRRALFPGHPLGFVEPPTEPYRSVLWPYVQAAASVYAGDIALVLRATSLGRDDAVGAARAARAASLVAADVATATKPGALTGAALEHARGMIAAALVTLDGLAEHGWRTVAGEAPGRRGARAFASDAVVERMEAFDPFAMLGLRG